MPGSNFLAPLAAEQQQLITQTFLTAYKRGADDYAAQKQHEYESAKQKMANDAQLAKENLIQSGENYRAQAKEIGDKHKEMLSSFGKAISDLTTVAGSVASNLEAQNMDSSSHAAGQDLRQRLGSTLTQLGPAMASILSSDDYKSLPKDAQGALDNIGSIISSYKPPKERQINLPAYGNTPAQTLGITQAEDLKKGADIIHTYASTDKELADAAKARTEAGNGGGLKPEQLLKNQDDFLGSVSKFVNHRDWNVNQAPKLAAMTQLAQQMSDAKAQRDNLMQKIADPTLDDGQKQALRQQIASLPDLMNGYTGTVAGQTLSFVDDKDFSNQYSRLQDKAGQMNDVTTGGYAGATTEVVNRILRGDGESLPQFKGAQGMLSAVKDKYDLNSPEGVEKWMNDAKSSLQSPNATPEYKGRVRNTLAAFGVSVDPAAPAQPKAPIVPYSHF